MIDLETMTEEQGMDTIRNIFLKFGFVGTYFNREDADSLIDRKMTDVEWERLCDTRAWRKGIEETMIEHAWDLIEFALDEAGVARNDEVE
jgi:predicted HD phosphohydrolase